ncbi:hypothetical protein PMAYCL1PPCAC_24128, partial [Pristionchus mayeri]
LSEILPSLTSSLSSSSSPSSSLFSPLHPSPIHSLTFLPREWFFLSFLQSQYLNMASILRLNSHRLYTAVLALGGHSGGYSSPLSHPLPLHQRSLSQTKIENAYKKLQGAEKCKSLLKKNLTKDVLDKCKGKKTKLGATLYDCISSGVENLDAGVGVHAPDAEAYRTFAPLFDKIIQDYHGFAPNEKQPPTDLGEGKTKEFPPLDPEEKVRDGRGLTMTSLDTGYPFNPLLKQDDYLAMEKKVKAAFDGFVEKDLK